MVKSEVIWFLHGPLQLFLIKNIATLLSKLLCKVRLPKFILAHSLKISDLTDTKFISIYRLSKNLARRVIEMVTPHMRSPSTSRGISIERKVCILHPLL